MERLERLPGERPPAAVGNRDRDHQRETRTALREDLLDGRDPCLGVERVEDRLEQQNVGAALDEAARLLRIGVAQRVERRGAERGIVDVGRDRQRPVGRPHRPGDEARTIRRPGGPAIAGSAREARPLEVQLVGERLERIVRLHDGRAAEGIRLDDVRAGREILIVDLGDDVGACENQQVVVPLHVLRMIAEPIAAEVLLGQRVALDHRTHRAVEHQDSLPQRAIERVPRCRPHLLIYHVVSPSEIRDGSWVSCRSR